ncbi:aminoglycoside phosphotransferase family protein [Planococcus salinus]|uniref:Aminoglycoside phosphotransferase family protein n=1 Tax=Planococcus salinus TaxID=1848460 RepID=A0A3M8PC48_9BACL|nr:aminoglycoside phosphotransferase family protein [Planococcus salinus]RNF41296.1 aminoglycoside phosphotransferase family protein [Planococcus salinus]
MLDEVLEQLGVQTLAINEVEDSYSSNVYKCKLLNGKNVYVKIPYTKEKYQRELEAYEILKGKVSIPEMLAHWSGNEECPGAFLLSELKGKPLTLQASSAVAFQVGVLHATLHNIQPTAKNESKSIENEFSNWLNFVETQFYNFAEDVREIIDAHLYDRSIAKFNEMKQRLPSPDGPSFLHMDFRPANIIVDKDNVSGIIDFESVQFGSTEVDFTKLYRDFLCFDTNLYQSYQDGYKSIRPLIDMDAVLPFYQFTDAFNSIGWCKRRGAEKNASFLNENLTILKKILG